MIRVILLVARKKWLLAKFLPAPSVLAASSTTTASAPASEVAPASTTTGCQCARFYPVLEVAKALDELVGEGLGGLARLPKGAVFYAVPWDLAHNASPALASRENGSD